MLGSKAFCNRKNDKITQLPPPFQQTDIDKEIFRSWVSAKKKMKVNEIDGSIIVVAGGEGIMGVTYTEPMCNV